MRFGNKTVIEDLSFEVIPGEVFGFLGSNGSGKTTTIRALLGIIRPTAGTLLINGKVFTPETGSFLGYLPEERGLYKKENVIDTMVYFGRLKGLTYAEAYSWSIAYLKRVELADKEKELISSLSGGQQQKVQMGVTIMNQPSLLILDEPTKGFDPVNRRLMLEIVEERRKEGTTIILVTHQMEEAEQLCDHVMLLKDGTKRLYGTVPEIKSQYGSQQIKLQFSGSLVPELKLYEVISQTPSTATLQPKKEVTPQDIFKSLVQPSLTINSFEVEQSSLDDIFVKIYSENKA